MKRQKRFTPKKMVCYEYIRHSPPKVRFLPVSLGAWSACMALCFHTDKTDRENPLPYSCWVVRGKGQEAKGLPLRHSSVRGDLTWCLWGTCAALLTVGVCCEQAVRGHVSTPTPARGLSCRETATYNIFTTHTASKMSTGIAGK